VGEDLCPWVEMLATLAALQRETPEERMAGEWLERLASAARQLGFEAVYVLFDRVDGLTQTAKPENCAALVRPLLDSTALLSTPDVYFKLFLPLETRPSLEKMAGIRSQRVVEVVAEWDKEKLRELLKRRLWAASGKKLEELGVISEEEIKGRVNDKLIHCAQTPRHLIRLGHRLFVEHERLSPESPRLTKRDLDVALEQEKNEERWESDFQRKKHRYRVGQLVSAIFVPILVLLTFFVWQGQGFAFVILSISAVFIVLLDIYILIALYLFADRTRRIYERSWTRENSWGLVFRLLAFIFLFIFLSSLALIWLPSLIPHTHTLPYSSPGTSAVIFSTYPRWGALGGTGAIQITALGVQSPVTVTVSFSPLDSIEWPDGKTIYWQAGGATQTCPVRFIRSGWLYYATEIQTGHLSERAGGGWMYVLPLPAPLMSRSFSLTGLAISAVVTALAGKVAQWASKVIP